MRILVVEPYFGTSHRSLVEGFIDRTSADTELFTLPPNKWKWRMRTGAWTLAEQAFGIAPCDTIFASDYLDLPAFLALGPPWLKDCRKVVYFHENQMTYPLRAFDERDFHFALTNIETALVADAVVFNSEFHRREFIESVETFSTKFRAYFPDGLARRIEDKSCILPVPLDIDEMPPPAHKTGALKILWNMRWEFDKAPEAFFEQILALQDSGADFQIAVAGEAFQNYPKIFDTAREQLADRILSWGFLQSRKEYLDLMANCEVVVSTAVHEFFGVAVAEAVACGCFPLLPNRLAYPERYPHECLYNTDEELRARLLEMAHNPAAIRETDFRRLVHDLDWKLILPEFEALLEG
ncbi:MAG TPA: DUF3524 domain-containing protein [candidate division Zixibacteria bacterium]|nr:DUF3524 domain-containing protein [candidate division Zixibacteria bacterium]